MKQGKASRAMGHIDDNLILSALYDSESRGENAHLNLKGKKTMKNTTVWKKWAAVAAVFAIMLTAVLLIGTAMGGANAGALIVLDVNPSIELEVNKNEKVTRVEPINDDAVIVIGDMDLIGVDLNVALNAIVGSMMKNGYIKAEQNSILISVNSENSRKADKIKNKISQEVDELFTNSGIEASVITQVFKENEELRKLAGENGISTAKAALIYKIVSYGLLDANGVPYTAEVLAARSVNELKLILESKTESVSGFDMTGTASNAQYISFADAKSIALLAADTNADAVTKLRAEIDWDDDIRGLVYEVEFKLGDMKYDYEIHAKTGDILEEEIEPYNERDDSPVTPSGDCMSREEALAIAYEAAGVKEEDVKRPKIELDREGKTYVYEIEFKSGGMEYEYEINAVTGKVIEFDVEKDD